MKFILFLVIMVLATAVLTYMFKSFGESAATKKNVRNYAVRFDPVKEKYYITNQFDTHDEDVVNFFGNRVYYEDKPKAEFIVEKMNP